MASPQTFNSFLFAAAVAGIGVGGSILLSWMNNDRQTTRDIAILQSTAERSMKELEKIASQQQVLVSLGIRITIMEGSLSKHEMILDDLRNYRMPQSSRDWQQPQAETREQR